MNDINGILYTLKESEVKTWRIILNHTGSVSRVTHVTL